MSTKASDITALPPGVDAYLTLPMVLAALSRNDGGKWVRAEMAAGRFPQPDTPPGEDPKWLTSTYNTWVRSRSPNGKRVQAAAKR